MDHCLQIRIRHSDILDISQKWDWAIPIPIRFLLYKPQVDPGHFGLAYRSKPNYLSDNARFAALFAVHHVDHFAGTGIEYR